MILVTAFAQVTPEAAESTRAAMQRAQEESRTEDGCESYRFYAAVDDPTAFASIEQWRDLPALQVHMATPNVGALVGSLQDVLVSPIEIKVYDATQVELG